MDWNGRRRIAWNAVLIKPFTDHSQVDGLDIDGSSTPQWHWEVLGEVVVAPMRNLFFQPKKPLSHYNVLKNRRQYSYSIYYNSPVKVKQGDVVMFDFTCKYDINHTRLEDGTMLIKYHSLIAVLCEREWSALNGFLIVELMQNEEIEEVAKGLYFERLDRNKYGYAKVLYSGMPVQCFNEEKTDPSYIPVGANVFYNRNAAVGIELDIHSHGTRWYKLHQKDVLLWSVH